MQKLVIEDDEGRSTVVPLLRDEISVGRKEGNTIRLTERNVSRRHCRLIRQNDSLFVEDLNSYNGVKLNGGPIQGRVTVREGDRIQIGDYLLAVRSDRAETTPPTVEVNDQALLGPGAPAPATTEEEPPTQIMEMPPAPVEEAPVAAEPAQTTPDPPGHLLGTNLSFDGKHFALNRPSLIIGRSMSESDIILDHTSVSRGHARIVWDGTHYSITDLDSRKGMKVDGEVTRHALLTARTSVEIGDVQLSFLPAGEELPFRQESTALSPRPRPFSPMPVIIAVGFAIALLGIAWTKGWISTESEPTAAPPQVAVGAPELAGARVTPEEVAQVEQHFRAEDWDRVIEACAGILARDPSHAICAERKSKADVEQTAKASYEAFRSKAEGRDFDGAVSEWNKIPPESVYVRRGRADYATVRQAYVEARLRQLRVAVKDNQCDLAEGLGGDIETVGGANPAASGLVASCGEPPPKPRDGPGRGKRKEKANPDKEPTVTSPATDTAQLAELLTKAESDYVKGDHRSAISTARQALRINSRSPKAWRIIGVSSCYLGDRDEALRAYKKLKTNNRQLLRYVCQRNGVTLP